MYRNKIIGVAVIVLVVAAGAFFYLSGKQDPADTPDEGNNDSRYIEYADSSLTDETNIIFFHASWCPTCRGLEGEIKADLDSIPTDMTILKADFDTEIELRQKYEVTYQHTLVQVDSEGNLIKKWSGSRDISEIVSEVAR